MGLRFRKSIKLLPGVRLNIGLKSASVSIGGRGATYNIGARGSRVSVGIPGSGLSYTTNIARQNQPAGPPAVTPKRRLPLAALMIILFVLAFAFVMQMSGPAPNSQTQRVAPSLVSNDATIPAMFDEHERDRPLSGPVPVPRPRPKALDGAANQPLQITPNHLRE